MVNIKIKSREHNLGYHFSVEVVDEQGSTSHKVTMDRDFVTRIGANYEPEQVVRKSFEFLLSREPKEAILTEFDLTVISQYFPEYIPSLEKMLQTNESSTT